ncbi:BTB/POZ domain-containing protein KCTD16 [Aphelenchoides besseyi]|nr:BTB/POZ domain-containing protein KCTD16 [Aphelenchoides besseyi]KAI6225726.1 BTB/POZ domain-containing protein KCTD16 [Aphelenchoides besseyi]
MPLSEPIVQLRLAEGRVIQTFASVLLHDQESLFAELLNDEKISGKQLVRIECSHRDKRLLRFLVDCLRQMRQNPEQSGLEFVAPEDFEEWRALIAEAHYWRLNELENRLRQAANQFMNTITISYHGALTAGKAGIGASGATSDVNFRRIHRILVHGQAWICREVFGHHLNENRDGNVDSTRYTSRFYLTHTFLEQAFDALASHRFHLISGTSHTPMNPPTVSVPSRTIGNPKSKNQPGGHTSSQERQFLHYSQFVFVRTS